MRSHKAGFRGLSRPPFGYNRGYYEGLGGAGVSERMVADLGRLLDELAKGTEPMESENLAKLAEHVARVFEVEADEVAILVLVKKDRFLKFVIPEKLQAIGTIPMTSTSALAVRTVREKRPELVNNFTAARHASVFEGVPLGRRPGELIHKIMSAPILLGDKVLGAVQISRKGRTPTEAGPDFAQKDLRELISLSGTLGRFAQLCQVP